jgi:hypothetical protein
VFVFVLIIVGLICIISPKSTGYDAINKKASGIVEDALAENVRTFILVSGLKAGLAVIEGSTVGAVLVDVEIGDIVQPSYDFVDQIWKFLFYGLLILSIYEFILEFGLLSFGIRIMGCGLLIWGIGFLVPVNKRNTNPWTRIPIRIREWIPSLARSSFLFGVLLAYLVPLTLIASYGVRGFVTEPVKIRKSEEIRTFEKEFDRLREEFLSVKEELSVKHPLESSDRARTRTRMVATSLLNSFNSSLQIFLYYVVIIFVEVVIFPLLTAYVLYKFGQLTVGRFSARAFRSRDPGVSELSET